MDRRHRPAPSLQVASREAALNPIQCCFPPFAPAKACNHTVLMWVPCHKPFSLSAPLPLAALGLDDTFCTILQSTW